MSLVFPPPHFTPTRNWPVSPTPQSPAHLTMASIQQQLGRNVLSASRIPINAQRLYGLQEGQSVPLLQQSALPVAAYLPQAVKDALFSASRTGVFFSAATGVALFLMKRAGIWAEGAPKGLGVVVTLLSGLTTGLASFGYALFHMFRQSRPTHPTQVHP